MLLCGGDVGNQPGRKLMIEGRLPRVDAKGQGPMVSGSDRLMSIGEPLSDCLRKIRAWTRWVSGMGMGGLRCIELEVIAYVSTLGY